MASKSHLNIVKRGLQCPQYKEKSYVGAPRRYDRGTVTAVRRVKVKGAEQVSDSGTVTLSYRKCIAAEALFR